MKQMTQAAVERAMKLQEVMLRAMAKRITWYQVAEILGISCQNVQYIADRAQPVGGLGLLRTVFVPLRHLKTKPLPPHSLLLAVIFL
jgi:hypothetical protein